MRYKGGRNTYGHKIGILTLETSIPRPPGDAGNATTFDFPVVYKLIKGATRDRILITQDPALLGSFIEGARELAAQGCAAITTTCGFLAMFQKELAAAVDVPVFTSTLMQIPLVYRMLRPGQKIGLVCGAIKTMHDGILDAVGAGDLPLVIGDMLGQHEYEHGRLVAKEMDVEKAAAEVAAVGRKMLAEEPSIGAFVMESACLPPYSKALRDATGLPVFDFVTLINWVYSAVVQRKYAGYL